jgi:O-antigen/teichoic acid export membrane protein
VKNYFNNNYLRKTLNGKFVRNLLTLGLGTIIAQLIPILASPLLTRLYSPDEFGLFANFLGLLSILLVFYTGKFDLAVILPKQDNEAINIAFLSFFLIVCSTVITIIFFLLFGEKVLSVLNIPELSGWIWLIPLAGFFSSTYVVINEWYIRKDNFTGLSKNKIVNTSGITIVSLLFGFIKLNVGLILGQIIGQFLSIFFAFKIGFKYDYKRLRFISIRKMKYFAIKYIDFAKLLIPGQFINTIASQVPVFVITAKFGLVTAGLLAFSDRILGVPMNFIGNSVRDVFKQRASRDYKNDGNCLGIYKKVTFSLLAISIVPFIILFISAPYLFSFIFGEEWLEAGKYARILSISYLLSFISMPTSWVFVIGEKQKLDFLWQISFFVCTFIPLIAGVIVYRDAYTTILLLSIGRSFSYILQILMTYKIAKGDQ